MKKRKSRRGTNMLIPFFFFNFFFSFLDILIKNTDEKLMIINEGGNGEKGMTQNSTENNAPLYQNHRSKKKTF
uniref:Uncharacterized protein n=1 Tax=Octopus bimaculoides TaxID=37653 RepID=A0A0L8GDF8_OCTBM